MSTYTKRASKACAWCHARKVRCDATTLGRPCTRCRQDDRNCVMRKKIQTNPTRRRALPEPEVDSMPVAVGHDNAPAATSSPQNHVLFSSYPFLELDGFSSLTREDVAFLNSKGCLQVPAPVYLEEFVRQYFLHIQPCTPIIDESVFWDLYRSKTSDPSAAKLPLLLFQTILFASSPYISVETAQLCGFDDKRNAWNTLYQRAKFLYHFQSGEGALVRAQAALLLTFHTSANQPQAATLWLTHAVHAACEASFDSEGDDDDHETVEATRSRLWWSILIRDRSLSLGLRRQPQVSSFELRMLKDLPREEWFEDEVSGSHIYDPGTKRMLFVVFRSQCQLALLLTEMVSIVFGTHGLSLPFLSREGFQNTLGILNRIRTSLQLWKQESPLSHTRHSTAHSAVIKFTQLTMMYYQTARMELAHYEALLIERHRDYVGGDYTKHLLYTGNMLHDATTRLVALLEYFSNKGKVQILPLTIVGYMSMPLILSAINFKLSSTDKEQRSRRLPLECLWELMSHSRRVYDVTDFISTQTDDILRLAYLTSQQVFLDEGPDTSASASDFRTQTPGSCASNDVQLGKGRVKNWHDAFLRHTRAYLLIATTVDYFMSVGRLPSNNALPELVCIIPPLGKVRLPWLSQARASRIKARPRQIPAAREEESEDSSSPETVATPSALISRTGTGSNPAIYTAHESIMDLDLGDDGGSDSSSHDYDQSSLSQVNLDYLDLNVPVDRSPLVEQASMVGWDQSPQTSPTVPMERPLATSDLWNMTDMNASYDTYLHGLVEDCLGSTTFMCS